MLYFHMYHIIPLCRISVSFEGPLVKFFVNLRENFFLFFVHFVCTLLFRRIFLSLRICVLSEIGFWRVTYIVLALTIHYTSIFPFIPLLLSDWKYLFYKPEIRYPLFFETY